LLQRYPKERKEELRLGVWERNGVNLSCRQPQRLSFPFRGEFLPELVDFLLRLAVHEKRNGGSESEMRAAVQGDELLAVKLEPTDMT
jgi:hypothetical protein